MAALTNTQISVTYVGLLKTSANTVLSATAQQITDGSGNNTIMYLSTAGVGIGGSPTAGKELDVTGNVLITGDLQVDNININGNTISATSGVVTLQDGTIATTQSQSDNSTKVATTAYVDAAVTAEDLDFAGDSGTGAVDLDSQTFTIAGTSNEIETSASGQTLTVGLPDDVTVTGNLTVNGTGISLSNATNPTITVTDSTNGHYLTMQGLDAASKIDYLSTLIFEYGAGNTEAARLTSSGLTITEELTVSGTGQSSFAGQVTIPATPSASTDAASKGYVDSQVGANNELSEVLANGNTTGGTDISVSSGDDITFADSSKAIFGDGSDLEIYHDGSKSVIADVGTGALRIAGTNFELRNADQSKFYMNASDGGAINLYYDNSKKFETTSAGVTVTGDVLIGTSTTTPSTHYNNLVIEDVAGNNVGISLISGTGNNTALYFGDSDDTDIGQIKYSHSSNDMFFVTNATTALTIDSSQNATFAGNVEVNGTLIDLDSAANAVVAIDRGGTSNSAAISWRNAGSEFFRAGIDTTSNDLWSLLHTCGSGLYFNGATMTFGFGRSPQTGITLPQGSTAPSKISWYDGSDTFAASIYANSSTDRLTFATKNSSNAETIAIEIDTTQRVGIGKAPSFLLDLKAGTLTEETVMKIQKGVTGDTGGHTCIIGLGTESSGWAKGGLAFERTGSYDRGKIHFLQENTSDPTTATLSDSVMTIASNGSIYNGASTSNCFFGLNALSSVTSADESTAFGSNALGSQQTNRNSAFGYHTLQDLTTGTYNTGIGGESLENITTGSYNTGIGAFTLRDSTTESNNTAVGYQALMNNHGDNNIAVGVLVMSANTVTGDNNTSVGSSSGRYLTDGNSNSFFGAYAGENTSTGTHNTFIGLTAGQSLTTGDYVTAVGSGSGNSFTGTGLTAIGYQAGYGRTGANYDTYVGFQAGYGTGSGAANASLGYRSLHSITGGDSNTAIGYESGYNITTGAANTFLGRDTGKNVTTTSRNTILGAYAGNATSYTGTSNTLVGASAGDSLTSGSYNVCIGDGAGGGLSNTNENVLIGHQTGISLNGHYNTCVGFKNLNAAGLGGQFNTSMGFAALNRYEGDENTAFGAYAAHYTTTATRTTAIGMQAGFNVSTGGENTLVGYKAGANINTGQYNVSVGSLAMLATTTGTFNIALGRTALYQLTTGGNNIGIGYDAFQGITATSYNTGVGGSVGTFQTGNYNTSMGYFSNYGVSGGSSGDYNTTMGYYAGAYNRGENNTFLGAIAGRFNSTGQRNTIVGAQAADNSTITGSDNTIMGFTAAQNITSGYENVFIGESAGQNITGGNANIGIGIDALEYAYNSTGNIAIGYAALGATSGVSGDRNIAIGDAAGYGITSGTRNILLGKDAGRSNSPSGNITTSSHIICLGNNDITDLYCADTTISSSDARDKTDIEDFDIGLDFITQLQPKTYKWDKRSWYINPDNEDEDLLDVVPDGSKKAERVNVGMLAQDVLELEKQYGYGNDRNDMLFVGQTPDEKSYGLKYERLVPVLINAIKELKQEIEILKSK